MTPEDLAELRGLHERATRDYASELHYRRLAFHVWIPDLLAEVERLSVEQAAVFAALREVLGTEPATLGQAAAQAITALTDARAELAEIRRRDETTGGVLYDVIRRALAGDLDEDDAVRQIERRLIQPLVAQRREAREKARRAARRRRDGAEVER
jgi:hypothetical protein